MGEHDKVLDDSVGDFPKVNSIRAISCLPFIYAAQMLIQIAEFISGYRFKVWVSTNYQADRKPASILIDGTVYRMDVSESDEA